MRLKKRAVYGAVIFALIASAWGGGSASSATDKKKETIVVELMIRGFSEPIVVKVPLNDLMGKSGAGGRNHYPDDMPGGYLYNVSAHQLRKERFSVAINVTLLFRSGTKKQIKGRMRLRRTKPSEAEYEGELKVKAYFETAPDNGMHADRASAWMTS